MKPPEPKLLKKNGFTTRDGVVWIRGGLPEVHGKIRAADLLVSDVDECIFPFIGQADAGAYALKRVIETVRTPGDAMLAARMLGKAGELVAAKIFQMVTGRAQNSLLIEKFEEFAMDVPMSLMFEGAAVLHEKAYAGVPDALRLFTGRGVPVGMISMGLDFFLESYCDLLERRHGIKVSFAACTRVIVEDGKFAGYDRERILLVPDDKARVLGGKVEEHGASRPLVIGHDKDDISMFAEARRRGGSAMGFNPMAETYGLLDAVVFAKDWRPLAAFLADALRRGEEHGA